MSRTVLTLYLLLVPLLLMAAPPPGRRFATQQAAAAHFDVHPRTIRNWISNGLITGYKLPTGRAIRVDLDECERLMQSVPPTVARPNHPAFGPSARIVTVAEVVPTPSDAPARVDQ
jgi:hypothetical protein